MPIDEMSGAALDALAATSVMGWHSEKDYWTDGGKWAIASKFNWKPSSGKKLSAAASDVLLKALGDGWIIGIHGPIPLADFYRVSIRHEGGNIIIGRGTTLPLALVRVICKAKEVKHE